MPAERRGQVIAVGIGATGNGRSPMINGRRQPSSDGTSRMTRECQVRICEGLEVQFLGPTRPDTAGLSLSTAGVELNQRGFVKVDEYLQTSAPHVFAAGDVIGHLMLVPEAMQDGLVAATNAVRGPIMPLGNRVSPTGSFTDPEYAQVGLTEANARRTQDVVTAVVRFDSTTRTIIDGHKVGFCKLIADRKTSKILGCHVVGERAVDIVQVAAIAIAGGMRVEDLARVPLSFPTYAGILVNAAADAARQFGLTVLWQTLEGATVIASQATGKTKEVP